jgi:hypothetical protein
MKTILYILLILFSTLGFSQDLVLIKFMDKPSSATYFANPTLMLSQKALDRRAKYTIELNMQDVPVETTYVSQVEALGIEPIAVSKWFNGVFAWCTDSQVAQAEALSFVSGVDSFVRDASKINTGTQLPDKFAVEDQPQTNTNNFMDFNYGYTETQVTQIRLDFLHDLGFTGEGVTIAVFDNGFPGVNTQDGFAYIRNNGQIKGGYNFPGKNENIYGSGSHGTVVLSTIGGYIENQYVGAAIDADYYLYITEDNTHEMPDEEVFWIAAAEVADSIGVDVISTSLGYNEFDDPRYNYVYDDMDGETTYITRGAQFAADRGIMIVVSAGNSGNKDWHYITAPADGVGVLTIGAVDSNNNPAGFSSYGPTSDGRIKPDVDALGSYAAVIQPDGSISYSSGTSFSAPIMAGAMACLIQAFPNYQPTGLMQKVRESASLYENPTSQMGYGIPDFSEVYEACLGVVDFDQSLVKVYPNPTSGILNIDSTIPVKQLQLISMPGKIIRKYSALYQLDISDLPSGVYVLKVQLENGKTEVKKLIKK